MAPGRPRVLLVAHRLEGKGGIEEHVAAMVEHLAGEVAFTALSPAALASAGSGAPIALTPGIRILGIPAEPSDGAVERAFLRVLEGHEVVHFHSLLGWNTLRLPRLAREAGARVVVSVHDKSWMCADFNMVLGLQTTPCGRAAARGTDEGCVRCIASKAWAPGPRTAAQVSGWLESRHAASIDALTAANALACPSEFAAASVRRAYGEGLPLRVIAHGVPDWPVLEPPAPVEALRVACIGRFSWRKGAGILIEAARRLGGERVELEAWGPFENTLHAASRAAGIRLRGPYRNQDLPTMLSRTDLVIVPTPLEEAFCLVVSEAQRLGVPVAASAAGAIPERVRDGESGFLFPAGDAAAIVTLLRRLRDDRGALDRVRRHLRAQRPRTHAECAGEYLALYRGIGP